MKEIICIGCGGFIGALFRHWISDLFIHLFGKTFPLGTLVVNVIGCLAMGVIIFLIEEQIGMSPALKIFIITGLLGALTTFSTFGYATFELLKNQQIFLAFLNIGANMLLGLGAIWLGRSVTKLLMA